MAVVVFDSDVVIGFLSRDDVHHDEAVERVRTSLAPGNRRLVCAVSYAEIMIGPVRAGTHELVWQMLVQFNVETIIVDVPLADRAAAIRVRTGLTLPDAFALATAIQAEHGGGKNVEMASFDAAVLRAYANLHPD